MKVNIKLNVHSELSYDLIEDMNDEIITFASNKTRQTMELKDCSKQLLLDVIKGLIGELTEARSLAEGYYENR